MTEQQKQENCLISRAQIALNRLNQKTPGKRQVVFCVIVISAILAAYLFLFFGDKLIFYQFTPEHDFRIRDFRGQITSLLIISAGLAGIFLTNRLRNRKLQSFLFWFILLALYTLRAPDDAFTSYLWAEDGCELIQDAIYLGVPSLLEFNYGSVWFLPRLVGLISYGIVWPFQSLAALPQLQGFITRIVAVSGIFYFAHERFSWLVSRKRDRVLICAAVILLIPSNGADILTCDTSLHFVLNIPVFLIGLDHFGRKEPTSLTIPETAFLFLMTLSTPAAIPVFAVGAMSCVRWLWHMRKTGQARKAYMTEGIKILLLALGMAYQLSAVFQSGRGTVQLDLLKRLFFTAKGFVFIPYWHASWPGALFGAIFLMLLLWLAKPHFRTTFFCVAYSYLFLMYCLLTADTAEASLPMIRTPRYVLISYAIAAILIGLSVIQLMKRQGFQRMLGILITAVFLIVSWQTFYVEVIGKQYIRLYDENVGQYSRNGRQELHIPVGPYAPWGVVIPVEGEQTIIIQEPDGQ